MNRSIETKCVHGTEHKFQDGFRAITFPLYQTAAFSHLEPGHNESGHDYTRLSNPTRQYLEETVSALENAYGSIAFSTGMAAISACFELLAPGDHIICSEDLYGGVVLYFNTIGAKNQLSVTMVDTGDREALKAAVQPNTKAIYVESPSNPMMNVSDIRFCSELAKEIGALLIVDNTFLTPYFQNPLNLGADLVVHSGTKFLGGHNDTLAGFVCCSNAELYDQILRIVQLTGGNLAPFDAWLIQRGIKTLAIRMERQQATAKAVAQWLAAQPKVRKVYYVGLPSHPGYELNASQASGSGSMISFAVDSKETALRVLQNVKVITFAESLGGPETLITYPATQTHRDVPEAERERLGITDTFLRVSIGLENVDDLIADLQQAMGE